MTNVSKLLIVNDADKRVEELCKNARLGAVGIHTTERCDVLGSAELKATDGYDHNYVLGRGGCAAVACGKKTGVEMTLFTDLPCMQLYTGGSLGGCKGKHDARYGKWAGFCLEPQYAPDAVNHDEFQKPLLEKGRIKKHCIEYKFLCK